jgi:hypothetical protein
LEKTGEKRLKCLQLQGFHDIAPSMETVVLATENISTPFEKIAALEEEVAKLKALIE